MRIILATHQFDLPGGSESYLITIAEQLVKLGHNVEIYTNKTGRMSDLARSREINVCAHAIEFAKKPDIIISQDGIVSYTLFEHWPTIPQLFVCHSPLFELQTPPLIPGVVKAVVAMSDRIVRRIEALSTQHKIIRLRQPIDVDRFVSRQTPHKRPKTALLLGNYLDGEDKRIITDAWQPAGVSFTQIGIKTKYSLTPEEAINNADIVVGKARAVLDAMACGRPAYVYDAFGTDGWVTPQNYEAMEADNFSGLALGRVKDKIRLRRDLDDYDPLMGIANRELVMIHHHARVHAQQLISLCHDLISLPVTQATPYQEMARLVEATWRSEPELFVLRRAFSTTADRANQAEEDNARLKTELVTAASEILQLNTELIHSRNDMSLAKSELKYAVERADFAQAEIINLADQRPRRDKNICFLSKRFRVRITYQFSRLTNLFRRRRG